LVGSSRDHTAVGELLVGAGVAERLVVEDTIGSGAWAAGHPGVRTGRGLRLVTELAAALRAYRADHAAWTAARREREELTAHRQERAREAEALQRSL
ncbi:hypothetical protein GUG60_09260, partial [Xanthomonas citri pv. citri]|nr:hypothetical protein [Xanthomonas citri pv. citri]